jgi:putative endonuclease
MKKMNKAIGNYGEMLALKYLSLNNHKILDSNFRNKNGEIDIITLLEDILIFIEVKTRYNLSFGNGVESVNYNKQKNIKSVARYYIFVNNLNNYNVRFDICEIFLNYNNDGYKINHIEDAFR